MTAPFPIFPAGNEPSAGQMQALLPLQVRKGSNQSIPSSTTLQNDSALFVTVLANATYDVSTFLVYDADTAGRFQVGFYGPTGFLLDWWPNGESGSVSGSTGSAYWAYAFASSTVIYGANGSGSLLVARPGGILTVGSTGGTFGVRWAQGTSSATATIVHVTSTLTLRRTA